MVNKIIEEFFLKVKQQHLKNIAKWGHQDKYIILAACTEELGELARAVLGNAGESHDLCKESVDLAALLIETYILGKAGRKMTDCIGIVADDTPSDVVKELKEGR